MYYGRESTGPGCHRYLVNARRLDSWRSAVYGGRILKFEEIEHFHKLRELKEKTPTEILYLDRLKKREN